MTSEPDSAWDDDARAERESLELIAAECGCREELDQSVFCDRHWQEVRCLFGAHEWVVARFCKHCRVGGGMEEPE